MPALHTLKHQTSNRLWTTTHKGKENKESKKKQEMFYTIHCRNSRPLAVGRKQKLGPEIVRCIVMVDAIYFQGGDED